MGSPTTTKYHRDAVLMPLEVATASPPAMKTAAVMDHSQKAAGPKSGRRSLVLCSVFEASVLSYGTRCFHWTVTKPSADQAVVDLDVPYVPSTG